MDDYKAVNITTDQELIDLNDSVISSCIVQARLGHSNAELVAMGFAHGCIKTARKMIKKSKLI